MSNYLEPDFPTMPEGEKEAYLEGFRRAVWLFSVWRDGTEYIGMDRKRKDVLADLEAEATLAWDEQAG